MTFSTGFTKFAQATAMAAGKPPTFAVSVAIVLLWLLTGPFFQYSDTWQLIINTGTTIVTFLMVFLLQHTQNRDTRAIQVKLDELIRAVHDAKNEVMEAENMDENGLAELQEGYHRLAAEASCATAEKPSAS